MTAGDDPETRFRARLRRSFELIVARADVRTLLLGGGGEAVAGASRQAQRGARAAMAAHYLSEPSFLAGDRCLADDRCGAAAQQLRLDCARRPT
jgi:hypothetical protein